MKNKQNREESLILNNMGKFSQFTYEPYLAPSDASDLL